MKIVTPRLCDNSFHRIRAIYACPAGALKRLASEVYTMKETLLLLAAVLFIFSAPAFSATLCPDGQYHADGACKLCPDGSYTTAPRCALAPDGKYIPDYGRGSKLAPDGRYIPDTGSMVLCPDGNYYPGRSCRLLPDGRYIGSQ